MFSSLERFRISDPSITWLKASKNFDPPVHNLLEQKALIYLQLQKGSEFLIPLSQVTGIETEVYGSKGTRIPDPLKLVAQ